MAPDQFVLGSEPQFICVVHAVLHECLVLGSNFLNRVELQNGCLTLAHANLFIYTFHTQWKSFSTQVEVMDKGG